MIDKQLEGTINAPEFPASMQWLNTDQPMSLKQLRGKLVLLDFWTFCCINCMHVIPDLKKLEARYPEELVVIGVHSAKFTNERETDQIRDAVLRYEIEHPVVNDSKFEIWNSYDIHAWPSLVLINPSGKVIGSHSGEGVFEPFDEVIGKAIKYFDAKGELKRSPLNLALESAQKESTVLSFPGKVTSDKKSKLLFITDSNNNRIIITDAKGAILDVIGKGTAGAADGSFETAEFNHPQGTCLHGETLYIADTENHLIRAANLVTRQIKTILGTGSQAHYSNQSGFGTDAALNSPWDLVLQDDKLYIAMAGPHQLWVANLETFETKPYAGSGREGIVDGSLLDAALAQPSGITADSNKLYFADSETSSIRTADLNPSGKVETIIGHGLFDYGDIDGEFSRARLQHPLGIALKENLLYVADTYNSKIKVIDKQSRSIVTYAGDGKPGYKDGPLETARFDEPSGLAFLDGRMYVADANNHLIRVIDTENKHVSTLQLSNLDRLAPRTTGDFRGRLVKRERVVLREGKGVLRLTAELPMDHKFVEDAPSSVKALSGNEKVVRFANGSTHIDSKSFPVEIPFEAIPGKTEIQLNVVIYYCRGSSYLCNADQIKVVVPVEVDSSGDSEIDLKVKASPIEGGKK